MIKFFRKIRRGLLTETKFMKYLVYAIGEIVLVVIGILIALSINNWNDNIKKNEMVKVYLQNFVEDLKEDKQKMEFLKDLNLFRYQSLQHLLKMAGEVPYKPMSSNSELDISPISTNNNRWKGTFPEEYHKEFVLITLDHSQRALPHELNHSTIDELKSTGLFSYLKNQELKESINNYYREWNGRIGEGVEQRHLQVIEKWQDALAVDGIITSDDSFEPSNLLALLKDHPYRVAILKRMIRDAAWIFVNAGAISKNADDLIILLQEEISRYKN